MIRSGVLGSGVCVWSSHCVNHFRWKIFSENLSVPFESSVLQSPLSTQSDSVPSPKVYLQSFRIVFFDCVLFCVPFDPISNWQFGGEWKCRKFIRTLVCSNFCLVLQRPCVTVRLFYGVGLFDKRCSKKSCSCSFDCRRCQVKCVCVLTLAVSHCSGYRTLIVCFW